MSNKGYYKIFKKYTYLIKYWKHIHICYKNIKNDKFTKIKLIFVYDSRQINLLINQ